MGLLVGNGGSLETKTSLPVKRAPHTRPRTAPKRAAGAPRTASNRADSGSNHTCSTIKANGSEPPKINTERQPWTGISQPAAKPIIAEPRLKPQNMMVIINERLRWGAYSDSSVVVLGIAAPSPI